MINLADVTKEYIKEHNSNWLIQVPDHSYRILITGKRNSLFNLITHQGNIDEIHLYCKDPCETKYQFLINNRESASLKSLNHSKAFIEYSIDMDEIYKIIEKYSPNRKCRILIAFDYMIAYMLSKKILD